MITKQELQPYYKAIDKKLSGSPKEKEAIMENLHNGITEFLEQNPGSTLEDVVLRFGSPEDFETEALSSMDARKLRERVSASEKTKKRLVIAGVITLVVVLIVTVAVLVHINRHSTPYYTESITETVEINSF